MDELTGRERQYDLRLAGVESSFKYSGLSLHSEYFIRSIGNVIFEGREQFADLLARLLCSRRILFDRVR